MQALSMLSRIQLQNICTSCGACCEHFRVSFYWAEGENIPDSMQEALTPVYNCMAGTNQPKPRCVALEGKVGECVSCTIYELRTTPCREVQPGDSQCLKARAAHNLIPLHEIPIPDGVNDDEFEQVS